MKELNKLGKKFNASLPKKQSKRSLGFAMLDDEKSKCMGESEFEYLCAQPLSFLLFYHDLTNQKFQPCLLGCNTGAEQTLHLHL